MKGLIRVFVMVAVITISLKVMIAMYSLVEKAIEALFVWCLDEGEEPQESADPAEKIQVGGA